LQPTGERYLLAARDPEAAENTLERVANTVVALREQVAVTRNKVIPENIEGLAAARGALFSRIPREERQAKPPPEE
jgi:hypothetical protein